MSPELRQQYLQAMGIQLWQSRNPLAPEAVPEPEAITDSVISAPKELALPESAPELAPEVNPDQTVSLSNWSELEHSVNNCVACELHQSRTQAVIAEGLDSAKLMIITTAPSNNAETSTSLLSAESSQLLSNMLKAIDVTRNDIYFTSLVKCQLPQERDLRTTEVLCCEQYLTQQIEKIQPNLIVALGEFSAQHLVVSKKPLQELRSKTYQYHSIPLIVMSHPDELLLNPGDKRNAWRDLLQIKQKLNV